MKAGKGKRANKDKAEIYFLSFQKGTSLCEGSFTFGWGRSSWGSAAVGSAVFGGTIEGCATSIGTVIGGAIMVGCAMVSIAIAGGTTKGSIIRGSTRLHHLLVHHHRQRNRRMCNPWVPNRELRSIRVMIIREGGFGDGDGKDGGWGSIGSGHDIEVFGGEYFW